MRTKHVIPVAVACAACASIIFGYASLRGKKAPANAMEARSGVPAPARIVALQQETQPGSSSAVQDAAAARVSEIRDKARRADATKRVASKAIQESDTTTVQSAERDLAEVEKSLQDSLANLTQQLVNQPEMTTNAIALLRDETDPATMMMIAQALGEAAAVLGDKFPYDLLLDMAQNDQNLARRQAALMALGYMNHIPPDLERRVAEVSRTAPTTELRTAAINTMGSWMSRNRSLTQKISEKLLETRSASDETMVRASVLQTIGNMDSPLSPKVLQAMSEAVVQEPHPWSRSLAAVALGSGTSPQNRDEILNALENAYLNEPTLDTKRHIITQITKASRYDAENFLQRLPTPHPLLEQDVKDYVEILNSMDRNNWGQIWEKKSERDHQRGTYPGGHGGHDTDPE